MKGDLFVLCVTKLAEMLMLERVIWIQNIFPLKLGIFVKRVGNTARLRMRYHVTCRCTIGKNKVGNISLYLVLLKLTAAYFRLSSRPQGNGSVYCEVKWKRLLVCLMQPVYPSQQAFCQEPCGEQALSKYLLISLP